MLGAALTALAACGTAPVPQRAERPSPLPSAAPSGPPTLAPGPAGLTPVFRNGPRGPDKVVALTFDADMTAGQGERAARGERFDNPGLIDSLRTLKVPATVFMTGRWAEEYPVQARSIGRDPLFEVANHSYSHYAFTEDCYGLPTIAGSASGSAAGERMRADVERAFSAFRAVGVPRPMPYFRFPGGCYDRRALRAPCARPGSPPCSGTWSAGTPSPRTPVPSPGRYWTAYGPGRSSSCTARAVRPRRPSGPSAESCPRCASAASGS